MSQEEWNKFGNEITGSRWFNQEPELVLQPMTAFEAHWMCPITGCGGEMKFNGQIWTTADPGYHHSCDKCCFQAAIKKQAYPKIIYKPASPSAANHR